MIRPEAGGSKTNPGDFNSAPPPGMAQAAAGAGRTAMHLLHWSGETVVLVQDFLNPLRTISPFHLRDELTSRTPLRFDPGKKSSASSAPGESPPCSRSSAAPHAQMGRRYCGRTLSAPGQTRPPTGGALSIERVDSRDILHKTPRLRPSPAPPRLWARRS